MAIQFYPATLQSLLSLISIESLSQHALKCTLWTASKSSYISRNYTDNLKEQTSKRLNNTQ